MTSTVTKIYLGGKTYTVVAELDDDAGVVTAFRVYKAWSEYKGDGFYKKHKNLVSKETNLFQALMSITSDFSGKQMVMIPAEYLKELQSLRTA